MVELLGPNKCSQIIRKPEIILPKPLIGCVLKSEKRVGVAQAHLLTQVLNHASLY